MSDFPPGNDWLPYRHAPPSLSPHDIIELWRDGWGSVWSGRHRDINPMMNACGLWWRPRNRKNTDMQITAKELFDIMQEAVADVCKDEEDTDLLTWDELDDKDVETFFVAANLVNAKFNKSA